MNRRTFLKTTVLASAAFGVNAAIMRSPTIAVAAAYNRERAVNYAYQWALARNSKYPDFTSKGGDCTSFASQVLAEAGIPMEGKDGLTGNKNTFYEWFARGSGRSWKWTSSWNYTNDFRLYMVDTKKHARLSIYQTDDQGMNQLVAAAQPGDIIQIATQPSYSASHTMIIVGKGNGDLYCAYHNASGFSDQSYAALRGTINKQKASNTRYLLLRF